jgi:hypothetical protein
MRQFGDERTPVSLRVPRYAGAGDTSVHRVFREIERLLLAGGEHREAVQLSEVLADTLARALRGGRSNR